MAAKSIAGTVRSTQLEEKIGKTIMGEYVPQMDNYLISNLKREGENVAMPTLGYFVEENPELKQRLINLYNGTMGLVDGVEHIPDSVKVSQGALLDGLCYGYDIEDDTFGIYTMNFGLLLDMEVNKVDMAKQCIEKNKIGQVKGYRIDVEYINSPESFTFKAVNHRKPIDDEEKVFLVPYIAGIRLMKMIESFLNSGMVIKTCQLVAGSDKVRCITRNVKTLAQFCDDPYAIKDINPTFFPLKAFFYAPVLGAPSTTAMVTNINLFALTEIKKIKNLNAVKKLGIEKPENPVKNLIEEQIIATKLMQIKSQDIEGFCNIIAKLPRVESIIKNVDEAENVSDVTIYKYLHSLTQAERNTVVSMIPDADKAINSRLSLFKESRPLSEEEMKDIRGTLKNHICRFTIRKKDCTLSSITCTNCPAILRGLYGNDYFAKYEGFSIRFSEVIEEIANGRDLEDSLEDNGFYVNEEQMVEIEAIKASESVGSESFVEELRKVLADFEGVKTRAKSQTSNIMVRTCSAYITEDGVQDYYRYLDPEKIVSCMVLS